jgi:arginine N-succinyltransferase
MIRVRPVQHRDLEQLVALAGKAGRGMTTMPQNERAMSNRIYLSQEAFARAEPLDKGETFFMVLEEDGEIVGMCCIFTKLGHDRPFYSYRLSHLSNQSPDLDIRVDTQVMHLVNDYHGYTEIGTLFVDPDKRQKGIGRFLSFSRFMLMAANPGRFGDRIMAEIRGWSDEHNSFPFWGAVGEKFFRMDFVEADKRSAHEFRFIADLMPKYPIYAELLDDDVKAILGKAHDSSKPAMGLLESQGFRYNSLIDIFDAGPSVDAHISNIELIKDAHMKTSVVGKVPAEGQKVLVAKKGFADFVCIETVMADYSSNEIALTEDMIKDLEINTGDDVLVAALKGKKS